MYCDKFNECFGVDIVYSLFSFNPDIDSDPSVISSNPT